MKCIKCLKVIGRHGVKFCSRSCAVSFNNQLVPKRKSKNIKQAKCLNCKTEFKFSVRISRGKFCSPSCSGEHKKKLTRKAIVAGTNSTISGMRDYLIDKFGEKCSCCSIGPIWNKKRLVLQLDHIDGDSDNNHRKNLRLMCPNCHTQTDTFGAKGMGNRYRKNTERNCYLQEYKARQMPPVRSRAWQPT